MLKPRHNIRSSLFIDIAYIFYVQLLCLSEAKYLLDDVKVTGTNGIMQGGYSLIICITWVGNLRATDEEARI